MTVTSPGKKKLIEIFPPIKGEIDSRVPQGHHPDSRDMFVTDGRGNTRSSGTGAGYFLGGASVKTSLSWEQPVYAPFDGKVIKVVDHVSDRMKLHGLIDPLMQKILGPKLAGADMDAITGNHIMLQTDDGLTAFFAHLREGSAQVVDGEIVSGGQVLAKVGNSGLCLEPHLHFHITDDSESGQSQPVPFVIQA